MKMFNGVNESRNYLFIQSAKGEKFFFLPLLLFSFNGDNIKVLSGYIFLRIAKNCTTHFTHSSLQHPISIYKHTQVYTKRPSREQYNEKVDG